MASNDFLNELDWRGLLHQCTDRDALAKHLAEGTRTAYAGFDPTSNSLTIGNLVPMMVLAHLKRAGHRVVVLMGGGTGLIGDPSGKTAERQLQTAEQVERNVAAQRPIFDAVLGNVEGPDHRVVNNAEWLTRISYIEALRDIGKHFSVNMMMQKESVKQRLESREQGISYTEFSYMILQAYDFLHLYTAAGVTFQMGGSDQFGNIVAGADLIRRWSAMKTAEATEALLQVGKAAGLVSLDDVPLDVAEGLRSGQLAVPADVDVRGQADKLKALLDALVTHWRTLGDRIPEPVISAYERHAWAMNAVLQGPVYGLTNPLVTKADGTKFGKTESGAVWLTAERTSPYAYYQFWLNAADADVGSFLRFFTFLTREEIEAIEAEHAEAPGKREAQRRLAREATAVLHGSDKMEQAEAAGKALFSGDIASLDEPLLREVLAEVPSSNHDKAALTGEGVDPVDFLVETGLAQSRKQAREFLAAGSVSVNGNKLPEGERLHTAHLLHGSLMAIKRGKKNWHLANWS